MARILLADDEAGARDLVRRALELDKHTVTVVADGASALELIARSPDGFDLLVTDIDMPGMDGLALAKSAAKHAAGLPVLLISGHAGERDNLDTGPANIAGFLAKPFSLEEIRSAVTGAIA
ncbi:MAG: response regulator [Hyphomicrobiaceae bacterium]|nr:response regulator [Hyphomicrobiaceae bacterium]